MDIWTACEEAYKKGYTVGYKDGKKDSVANINSIILYRDTMEAKVDFILNDTKYTVFIPWNYNDWN